MPDNIEQAFPASITTHVLTASLSDSSPGVAAFLRAEWRRISVTSYAALSGVLSRGRALLPANPLAPFRTWSVKLGGSAGLFRRPQRRWMRQRARPPLAPTRRTVKGVTGRRRWRLEIVVALIAVAIAIAGGILAYEGGALLAQLGSADSSALKQPTGLVGMPVAEAAPRLVRPPAAEPLGDPVGGAAFFLARAKAGDPAAQYDVGVLYARGLGLVQDYASAATWFRTAAAQGSISARYNLGVLYERGLGVAPNPTEAVDWYRRAAENDYPSAQYNLALMLADGRGAERDIAAAALWYQRAAQHGVVPAMINLAILYERGKGIAHSLPDAYAWYSAAGEHGDGVGRKRAQALFAQLSADDKRRAEALAASAAPMHPPRTSPPT
jgi:TPR repeat protein